MTERTIPAAGDDSFVRRADTSEASADAAFIPQPAYVRQASRKRRGVPPTLYVAPLVGVALLGGLALMTGTGAPETAAPAATPEVSRASEASPTALAANALEEPTLDGALPAREAAGEAEIAAEPAARAPQVEARATRPAERRPVTPAVAPAAPSATDAGTDVSAQLPEAPIPYSATAQSSAPSPVINTTPLDIPPADAAPSAPAETPAEPMTF